MIWTLAKINIRALFAGVFSRYGSKRKAKKTNPIIIILIGLFVAYIVGALGFTVGMVFYQLCQAFFDAGVGWFYFALVGILAFALCIIGGIFMVQSQVFSARDNTLLLSMPIKPSAILAGRLCALIIIEYVYAAIIFVPALVVLLISGYIAYVPVLGAALFLLGFLFIPLAALAVGCFVGWLVALMSTRIRNKNIPTLVLSLALLGAYFWFYSQMMNNLNMLIAEGAQIAEAVRRAVFPAYHFGTAVADGNFLSFLIFTVCMVAPFLLMYYLLSISFVKLTTGGRGVKKIVYKEKALQVSGAKMALLKRELMYLWSQPMYILNAALGSIAALILAGILFIHPRILLDHLEPLAALLPDFDIGFAAAIVLSALTVMNAVSAPSISLEGKKLWIVKSLPINASDVLLSKVWMHMTVSGIPLALAAIASVVAFRMDGLQIALAFILPLAATLMIALLGITFGLAFPRFDWINPLQPVKQGMAVMLTMFGSMALVGVLALVFALGVSRTQAGAQSLGAYLVACTIFFLAVSAGLYIYVVGAGSRKFESL
ncbi:MAG: hypothetical protein FWB97_07040 [Oscillospiraceae bacterium]|nr:hypothetical protein [Oscillospiraceae bacterium]